MHPNIVVMPRAERVAACLPSDAAPGLRFAVQGVQLTPVGPAPVLIHYYNADAGGGFAIVDACGELVCEAAGEQLYIGHEAAPTLLAGAFVLASPDGSATFAPAAQALAAPEAARLQA